MSVDQGPRTDVPRTYAVIGAGASGLIAARALLRAGIDVEILERHDGVGGLWNIDHPTSPLYESCNFISDRDHSGFIGHPMPTSMPEYPSGAQVLDYIRGFADRFGLTERVRFNTEVVRAEPIDLPDGTGWRITVDSGEVREYRGVVWACGQQQVPTWPQIEGLADFEGEVIHSAQYKRVSEFADRTVLVVGAGNSGVDIACDAAIHGRGAFLSMRRDYWFFPKRLFGRPLGHFLDGTAVLPASMGDLSAMSRQEVFDLIVSVVGDNSAIGLATPKDPIGSTIPIINDQVIHQISHGRLVPKPDVKRLIGREVEFVDGSRELVDLVVLATGYTVTIPWLDESLYETTAGEPDFHLGTFSRSTPGLYSVGLNHFLGHTWAIWDQLAQMIVADARAELDGVGRDRMKELRESFDLELKSSGLLEVARNVRLMDSSRIPALIQTLREEFGMEIPDNPDAQFYAELGSGS